MYIDGILDRGRLSGSSKYSRYSTQMVLNKSVRFVVFHPSSWQRKQKYGTISDAWFPHDAWELAVSTVFA